jgi:hypothetical protein
VIHEEQTHGRARAQGFGTDVGCVESEGGFAAQGGAGGSDVGAEHGASDATNSAGEASGIDGQVCRRVGNAAVDALDDPYESLDGAKDWVSCALVCAAVHLDAILLVFERDRDPLRVDQ